ncbi:monooxygenase 3-like [Arachis duranensis]|uniref:Monooxygenase 3-like n=1 Tax=Arachis duranensis TaxID=130453 RepID=A0A6P5N9K1_ARADU|nr:monooxygenase 3-like [Arachis duranensis]
MVVKSEDGRKLRSFTFKQEDKSQDVQAVERRVLLETLAGQLPQDVIQFSSKLAMIKSNPDGKTLLELADGSKLLAKILISCDVIRSPIAKWMGFPEANYVGYYDFCGLASYSEGQPYGPRVNYIYGRGVHAGYVHVSPTKIYWFICFNSSSPGPK